MPRSQFKRLSLGSLPRVMVAILAMDPDDRGVIAERIAENEQLTRPLAEAFSVRPVTFGKPNVDNLARLFDAILQLPKSTRQTFVERFDKLLDELKGEDFFGTEGQCDPRGDHRD